MHVPAEAVRSIVARALPQSPSAKVLGHRTAPFFEKRSAGVNGDFYSLTIDVEDGSATVRSLKFFAKTQRAGADPTLGRTEARFFDQVQPLLTAVEGGWSAECYLARDEGLLVFEDLREIGYAPNDSSVYGEELLIPALEALARFHGASIVAEHRLGKDHRDAFPGLLGEKVYTDFGGSGRANRLGFETLALIAGRLGFEPQVVPRIRELVKDIVAPAKGEGSWNVICHGDLWRTNVLFSSQLANKCILVDYQMLRYASPCTDVAMLVHLHTSREFRNSPGLKAVLDRYVDGLRQVARRHGVAPLPTREWFYGEYRRCRLLGMVCVAMRWPRAVFEGVLDDPEALDNWYTRSRIEVYQRCMNEDPGYREALGDDLREMYEEAEAALGSG